jgi:DNA-binding MarR family transcriptional regulator
VAHCLFISVPDLDARLAELERAGCIAALPPDAGRPVELTPAGESAHARLFAARQERVARLLDDWQPEQHPRLLQLLSTITHELAASHERPGPDLDAEPAATPGR